MLIIVSESTPKKVSEPCSKCNKGKMIHSELNVWGCDFCGFKYRMDPAAKKKDTVEILKKSIIEVRKYE